MNKKGFTLIELLAIIVILAIIAVITVPIILGIIDDAEMNSSKDSAYGFKDAVEKYYMRKAVQDSQYVLPSGYVDVSELPQDFSVSGETPTNESWMKLNKGIIEEYSLKINDYVITKFIDSDIEIVKNGDIQENEVMLEKRLIRESIGGFANSYVFSLNNLSPKIVSNVKSVDTLNQLVSLETEPSEGWVEFGNSGQVLKYSLRFDDYVVNYLSNQQTVTKDNIVFYGIENSTDGTLYSVGVRTVYYDPTGLNESDRKCEKKDYDNNSDKLGTTGCLRWFLYSVKGDYANMILDHNINPVGTGIPWVKKSDYTNSSLATELSISTTCSNSWGSYGNNCKGPLTALYALKTLTANSNWSTSVYGDFSIYMRSRYSINYSGYSARLISDEEIGRIKDVNSNSVPSELLLNISDDSLGNYGYWTSSNNSSYVYGGMGVYNGDSVYLAITSERLGIRPVIMIPKSILGID